jgi:hypothetical protein
MDDKSSRAFCKSQRREQAKGAYYGAVFKIKKEIPA